MNPYESGPRSGAASSEETHERTLERFPSLEAMKEIFDQLFEGREYEIKRLQIDERGVVLLEAEGVDVMGDKMELNFQRAKYDRANPALPTTARFSGSIHSVLYMGDDPCGGECLANYIDGVWSRPAE